MCLHKGGLTLSFHPVQTPGKEYRGVNLWFLNDRLEDRVLIEQLEQMNQVGCGAVITRTFDGLRTEYLSEEFHEKIHSIIEHSGRLGMKVFLQAGYMPAAIPKLVPEHQACVIAAVEAGQDLETEDQIVASDEQYTYVKRCKNNNINLLMREAVSSYLEQSYEEVWQPHSQDYGKAISSVWVDEPEFPPDQMPWSDELSVRFEEKWGYRLIDYIPDLFQRSERSYKVRYHYRRIALQLFIEAYFEQAYNWCEERGLLFSGHLMGEDRLDSQIGYTIATMPLYAYMQLPGIDHLTGNLNWTAMDRSGEVSIPFILTPKQASSAANQEGKKTVLAEMYGVSTEGLSFQDQKRIAEYLAILGINYRCLHASFYSIRGRRKRIYVPHLSEQQPWWEEYDFVSDYFARLSYALHQGTFAADVLVLHPIESAYGLYNPLDDRKVRTEDIYAMNAHLTDLSANLLAAQIGFEYGDEHVMEQKAYVDEEGRIHIGQMSYRMIVLPRVITVRESTLRLLEQFAERGGKIVVTGEFPKLVECELSEALNQLKEQAIIIDPSVSSLKCIADEYLTDRRVSIHAEHGLESILVHERQVEDQCLIYVLNSNEIESVEVEISAGRYPSADQYDLHTGELLKMPGESDAGVGVKLRFRLEPWESRVLLFNPAVKSLPREASTVSSSIQSSAEIETLSIPVAQMTMERADPNALTLDLCRYKKGDSHYSELIPVIAVQEILTEEGYEGPITLCYEFEVHTQPFRIACVIEDAHDYQIRVNDILIHYESLPYYVDRSFLPVDITSVVVGGRNRIELTRLFSPLKKSPFFHANRFMNIPGVELESIYLIGDFTVFGTISEKDGRAGCIRFAPGFVLGEEAQSIEGGGVKGASGENWALGGYPFYSGKMVYRKQVTLQALAPNERMELALTGLEACIAIVRVNGMVVSRLSWKPFKTDITPMIIPGENEIEIVVINTLRNLLGAHHHPKGEIDYSYGEESYSGRRSPEKGIVYPKWYENRTEDTLAWTDDYFVVNYGLAGLQITRYSIDGQDERRLS